MSVVLLSLLSAVIMGRWLMNLGTRLNPTRLLGLMLASIRSVPIPWLPVWTLVEKLTLADLEWVRTTPLRLVKVLL